MKVITSGLNFLDIDAYAGCVAYAELLNAQGEQAIAASTAPWNESITKTIRDWNAPLVTDYTPAGDDTFVLVDVSDPDFLDKIVVTDRVMEVIDHHVGFESFWQKKINDKTNIEFIGAACTQVFECWQVAERLVDMTELSARLLIAGILDNTLNFKANVTTDRDRFAYAELLKIANLPNDWPSQYFQECEASIFADIESSLTNDTKILSLANLHDEKIAFGQMVIWDGQRAIGEYRGVINRTMASRSPAWFVNVASLQDGNSYFLASDAAITHWAETTLDVAFDDGLAKANRLWLRKEIIKQTLAPY